MAHAFVTVVVPIVNGRLGLVQAALNAMGNPPQQVLRDALDAGGSIHFMSAVAVPGDTSTQAHLVIELSADGSQRSALEAVAAAMGAQLRNVILEATASDPGDGLVEYLQEHSHVVGQGWFSTPGLPFTGTPGLTVRRINRECRLAHMVAAMLDSAKPRQTALEILQGVRDDLFENPELKWAFVSEPAPFLDPEPRVSASKILGMIGSASGTLLWPFFILPAVLFAWVYYVLRDWPFASVIAIGVFFVELVMVYVGLRAREAEPVEDVRPSARDVREIMSHENHCVQNHMLGISDMKPGLLRRFTLRAGFFWVASASSRFSRPGFLGKIGSIHFARWILIPKTNKLVFFSNYDGSWESYLEDFIQRAHGGLSGVWSNTLGFPKTSNLLGFVGSAGGNVAAAGPEDLSAWDGAADGDRFKHWARRQQQPTHFWYSAYPDLTVERIRTNAAIRQGIANASTEAEAADWLACFGSAPRPADTIQFFDVPALLFGGLSRLRYASCIVLRLAPNADNCKEWLAAIEGNLSFGPIVNSPTALLAAFTCTGLRKLGIDDADLATFSVPFQQGMTDAGRARALGDVEGNDPLQWKWGRPGDPVDAVLLVYARDAERRVKEVDRLVALAQANGHQAVHQVSLAELPEIPDSAEDGILEYRLAQLRSRPEKDRTKEHLTELSQLEELKMMHDLSLYTFPKGKVREPFGFVDGVSQPIIRGTRRRIDEKDRNHIVEPGEFILGYVDNRSYLPPSPSVVAAADPANILPSGSDPLGQRPNFSRPRPNSRHDFGANGTYLVVRQLEQDVNQFEQFLDEAAAALTAPPPGLQVPVREWIAAKMVGRWKDGTSLVRYPNAPGSSNGKQVEPDNDFLFGVEDPNAQRCPFGAHIRRCNPRESFERGSPTQLTISNRHRVLRVGRVYEPPKAEPPNADDKPGLMFMCLNADIERQFEFVQQTWVGGPSFHGLERESDPMIGGRGLSSVMCIPRDGCPVRITGLRDFVRVLGGGYFFMPGRRAIQYLAR